MIHTAVQVGEKRRVYNSSPKGSICWILPVVDSGFAEGFDVESGVVSNEEVLFVEDFSQGCCVELGQTHSSGWFNKNDRGSKGLTIIPSNSKSG